MVEQTNETINKLKNKEENKMTATINRLWLPEEFNDLFAYSGLAKGRATTPAINVKETDDRYVVEMAAPGMKKENFKVHVDEDSNLVVKLENHRSAETSARQEHYLRRDFFYADFEQTLLLPDDVDRQKIGAQVSDGILTIDLPKLNREEHKVSRQIDIA